MQDLYLKIVNKQHAIHWKELGLQLGLPNDKIVIIELDNDRAKYKTQRCCVSMLKQWLWSNTSPTWGKLQDAINTIEVIDHEAVEATEKSINIDTNTGS